MNASEKIEYLKQNLRYDPLAHSAVYSVIRTLGKVNPLDIQLISYWGYYKNLGKKFFDFYHLLWHIGAVFNPKNIMEVGCRTGVSICQLLSSMPDVDGKLVVLFDSFWGEPLGKEDNRIVNADIVMDNLKYLNLPIDIVKFVIGHSPETMLEYRKKNPEIKFDYILVDGAHDYPTVKLDMENSARMLAEGGVILMDDIASPHGAPPGRKLIDVWTEFKLKHEPEFIFAENFTIKGVGVAVKKENEIV